MEKPGYGWLLKWILAAILLAVGITMFFTSELVFVVTGAIIIIFSVFRTVSLIKTLNTEKQRTLNLIEIVLSTLVGVAILIIGINGLNGNLEVETGIWSWVYKWALVFFFGARAIIYLYSVVFLEEKTEQIKFWTHLLLLPVATLIVTYDQFDAEFVGLLLLIISIIGGAYLIYDGTKGYGKYRKYQQLINPKQKAKEVEKDQEIEKDIPLELPNTDEEEDRPYIS